MPAKPRLGSKFGSLPGAAGRCFAAMPRMCQRAWQAVGWRPGAAARHTPATAPAKQHAESRAADQATHRTCTVKGSRLCCCTSASTAVGSRGRAACASPSAAAGTSDDDAAGPVAASCASRAPLPLSCSSSCQSDGQSSICSWGGLPCCSIFRTRLTCCSRGPSGAALPSACTSWPPSLAGAATACMGSSSNTGGLFAGTAMGLPKRGGASSAMFAMQRPLARLLKF